MPEANTDMHRTLIRMVERFDTFHRHLQSLRRKNGLDSDERGPTCSTVDEYATEEKLFAEILRFHGLVLTCAAEICALETGLKEKSWARTAEDLLLGTPQLEWL